MYFVISGRLKVIREKEEQGRGGYDAGSPFLWDESGTDESLRDDSFDDEGSGQFEESISRGQVRVTGIENQYSQQSFFVL